MEKQATEQKPRHLVILDGVKNNLLKLFQDVEIHQPSSEKIPWFNTVEITVQHRGLLYTVNLDTDAIAGLLKYKKLGNYIPVRTAKK